MALNSLIEIRQRDAGSDAGGQPLKTFTTVVASLWAEILHPSGVEQVRGGGQVSLVQASIKVRRRDGITAGMRVVHGSAVYDIRAVLPDEVERANMFLVCDRLP